MAVGLYSTEALLGFLRQTIFLCGERTETVSKQAHCSTSTSTISIRAGVSARTADFSGLGSG